jgi:uncharacterized membrane protein
MTEPNRATGPRRTERSAAVLLVTAVMVVTTALAIGTAHVGDAMLRRHRSQAVADVAALAAAASGVAAADRVARVNGAVVVDASTSGDGTVRVTVELGAVQTVAAAAPGD